MTNTKKALTLFFGLIATGVSCYFGYTSISTGSILAGSLLVGAAAIILFSTMALLFFSKN